MSGMVEAVIGVAVLGWVIWNQVRVRELTPRRVRIAGILGIVGVGEIAQAAGVAQVSVTGWALLVVGAALGLLRAATVNLWVADGKVFSQGHWGTAALWLLGVGVHVGLDLLAGVIAPSATTLNSSSILLFVAVGLGAQGLVTMQRARSLPGAPATTLERVR